MKREIKLQTQRYEEHQRRQKNQQYAELEQQIEYLTKQQTLTAIEGRVLNTVGTTRRHDSKNFNETPNAEYYRTTTQIKT
jgi:hypothetical protein